ncbi:MULTISPECIES: MoaD/ThiS family protein [unclassified Methyloversatilis]|jgi:sulfur carrier protein ThiS|uniref:sulfur carrier protein ThiS n=1 Tax=unclassified Methyloversatilis TaxID=2639971 RepID=UPI00083E4965|nr:MULTISPECIES: MoaD/ThiS family protein [unclassified Methyloversatilis]OYW33414.1 MAG: molybdopterin synthase sulfur carrier subunit [Methyloversatilis sp. 12-65-5]AOF81358.1 mut7-C ubiquitin family protein [Methyloversatilis sp. RAC08]MDP2869046.1 MoaD/ThiS family protein [Methyloversatilis sp.]MDP3287279.1 MoaD/ThiS family protein [Methyloversatilis sp.]MDP3455378.1 MoaD/ThiS family protein [Methyloversatilis sp.]
MRVTLKLYASLSDHLPDEAKRTNEWPMEVADGTTVGDLIDRHQLPKRLVHLVLVNGHYIPPASRDAHPLVENDVLAIWPPVAGG